MSTIRKRLTEERWIEIRTAWESGTATHSDLAKKYGVSLKAIQNRSSREKWTAKGLVPIVEAKIREKAVNDLAEAGMTKREFIEMVAQSARQTTCVKSLPETFVDPNGSPILNPFTGGPITFQVCKTMVDNSATHQARELLARIAGWEGGEAPGEPVRTLEDAKAALVSAINHARDGNISAQRAKVIAEMTKALIDITAIEDFDRRLAKVEKARSKPDSSEPDYLPEQGEPE